MLAALAGVTALVVTGQALARQAAAEDDDGPVLAALGLRSSQFAALSMLRTLAVAVAGAAGGVGVATLLSPFIPVGEARLADPAPGLAFDWPVAAAGAAAAVVAVLLLGLPPALRTARRRLPARPDPRGPPVPGYGRGRAYWACRSRWSWGSATPCTGGAARGRPRYGPGWRARSWR